MRASCFGSNSHARVKTRRSEFAGRSTPSLSATIESTTYSRPSACEGALMSQTASTGRQQESASALLAEPTQPIRLLAPDGVLRESCEISLDVTPDLCRGFYRDMTMARRLDQEAYSLQRQGELGLWLMALGQAAGQVGAIRPLRDGDH